jgi:hypothetical protein
MKHFAAISLMNGVMMLASRVNSFAPLRLLV